MTKDDFVSRLLAIHGMLYRVSYTILPIAHDQDDAVQETIRIALEKRESLREDRFFQTWIIRILINECYRIVRKRKREVLTDEVARSMPEDGNVEVIQALIELEVKLRVPMTLSYVEGYTNKEIAQILRIPEGTVKWRLAKGREGMKHALDERRA